MQITEAQKAQLTEYDFRVLIDTSGSMAITDCPRGISRLKYAQETTTALAHAISAFDDDGIDVITFGGNRINTNSGVKPDTVSWAFARMPSGSTPTAEALKTAFDLAKTSGKKSFILAITDGEPDDKKAVASVITAQANSQSTDEECTILFLQVGNDNGAKAFLTSLDDDLQAQGAKFDIVDSMHIDDIGNFGSIEELIIKAIND